MECCGKAWCWPVLRWCSVELGGKECCWPVSRGCFVSFVELCRKACCWQVTRVFCGGFSKSVLLASVTRMSCRALWKSVLLQSVTRMFSGAPREIAGGWPALRGWLVERRGKSRSGCQRHAPKSHIQNMTPCEIRTVLHAFLSLNSPTRAIYSLVACGEMSPHYKDWSISTTRPPFSKIVMECRHSSKPACDHDRLVRRGRHCSRNVHQTRAKILAENPSRSNRIIDHME